jgi:hypothetical protein
VRLALVVVLLACSKPKTEARREQPITPVAAFSADLGARKQTFAFGNAFITDGGLDVYLTTVDVACPGLFAPLGDTLWFSVAAGPDVRFFTGTDLEVEVAWREMLTRPTPHYGSTTLRIASVDGGRVRGKLDLKRAPNHLSIDGSGAFDVRICNPDAKIEKAPERTIGDHVEGTIANETFAHKRAFLFEGGASIVLTDNAAVTCETLKPAGCPAFTVDPQDGIILEIRRYDHHLTSAGRPATGAYWIMKKSKKSIETRLKYGLTVQLTKDDGKHLHGTVRAFGPHDIDVAGSFDAEMCPKTCY